MSDTKLLVILGEHNAVKLSLPSGIPATIEELKCLIQNQCSVTGDFRVQYMDDDFNIFVNLTSTETLKNMAKVKVVSSETSPEPASPHPSSRSSQTLSPISSPGSCRYSVDTDILSSPETSSSSSSSSNLRGSPWPVVFTIPTFNYGVDLQLKRANEEYMLSGALFKTPPKIRSDIMQSLASEVMKYKAYPSDKECEDVCKALIETHPFLREAGSDIGFLGWKISLKHKLANYRTSLRNLGCSELQINSIKRRTDGKSCPNQVKKPRRAEVNFCPDYPVGADKDNLEEERLALLSDVQKKNNEQVIKIKMEKTFALRREEILQDMPFIAEFKRRWPALFTPPEINAEFKRITTMQLTSIFMSKLDQYAPKLALIYRKKGGKQGRSMQQIMAAVDQRDYIDARRSCTLKALAVYLNEDPNNIIKEYVNVEFREALNQMEKTVIGIYVVTPEGYDDTTDSPDDVGIIIEGVTVLKDIKDVATAFSLLFGLIYVLNLNYPADLKYTFEFIQKVLMELDTKKLSNKVQVLKNKLLE